MDPSELDRVIEKVREDLLNSFQTTDAQPDGDTEAIVDEALRHARHAHEDMTDIDIRYMKPLVFAFARGYIQGRLRGGS